MTAGLPTLRGKRGRERRIGEAALRPAGSARRQPDLSALLPLLAGTGSFASLRERLTPASGPATGRAAGRHVGLSTVPHVVERRLPQLGVGR